MVKMILADDEPVITRGIRKLVEMCIRDSHRTFLQKVYCFSEQYAFFCCLHG